MIKASKMMIETKEEQAGLLFTRKQKQRMNDTFEQSYTPLADSIIISWRGVGQEMHFST